MFGKIISEDKSINPTGIGLGLTICNTIIKQLGGSLTFQSKFNEGSEFSFTLNLEEKTKNIVGEISD